MNRKKVLIVEPINQIGIDLLEKEGFKVVLASDPSPDVVAKEIEGVSGVIVRTKPFTKEIFYSADKLEVIGKLGIGVDNIDLDEASKRGIIVTNTPEANVDSVAEHTIGFMLALIKRFMASDYAVRNGNFNYREKCIPEDLVMKTLGIIGLGKIGVTVAKKCINAFNMKVLAYDPYVSEEKAKGIGVKLCDLNKLLKESDFVSLHAPLTKDTWHLIGENELKMMKPTSFLINVARGPLIDETALFKALKEKWISGAALDVFVKEPVDKDNPLLSLDNIIVTPHTAGLTKESFERMSLGAAEAVVDVLKGKMPKNPINLELIKKYRKTGI